MIAWVQTPAQNNHLHKRDSLSFEREVQNINLKVTGSRSGPAGYSHSAAGLNLHICAKAAHSPPYPSPTYDNEQ